MLCAALVIASLSRDAGGVTIHAETADWSRRIAVQSQLFIAVFRAEYPVQFYTLCRTALLCCENSAIPRSLISATLEVLCGALRATWIWERRTSLEKYWPYYVRGPRIYSCLQVTACGTGVSHIPTTVEEAELRLRWVIGEVTARRPNPLSEGSRHADTPTACSTKVPALNKACYALHYIQQVNYKERRIRMKVTSLSLIKDV